MTKHAKILGLVAALLGCTFLASASAATPMLNTIGVRTSSVNELLPSSQGTWFSWTQTSPAHPNHPNVFAQNGSGPKIKVNARGTEGAGSGIDGNTLVYYEWKGQWAGDIRKFNLQTHRRSNFPAKVSTRWDEYNPSISGQWVFFTRYFDTSEMTKVLLYNMQTHELRTLGTDSGRHRWVYSGQVNGDYAVWGRVEAGGGGDIYLYRISTNTNTTIPRAVLALYSPSVARDGTVYYGQSGNGCGAAASLVRYSPKGVATVLYDFPAGIDIGPSYIDERTDGSLEVFFSQETCENKHWDIYKAIDSHTLSVSKAGSGTGTVTSDPAGIDCGAACQSIFHGGRTVTFTATPGSGSVFSGWSDASCGTNPTCAIEVESDVSLTATFDTSP
jgi:hypothetical protein